MFTVSHFTACSHHVSAFTVNTDLYFHCVVVLESMSPSRLRGSLVSVYKVEVIALLTGFLPCFVLEKVHGVHQLPAPAGDEEWQVCPGLQAVPEDDPPGESQAGHPGQQLPGPQVSGSGSLCCSSWLGGNNTAGYFILKSVEAVAYVFTSSPVSKA